MLTHEESKVSDNSWSSVVSNAPNAFLLKRAHIYKAGEIDLFVMHRWFPIGMTLRALGRLCFLQDKISPPLDDLWGPTINSSNLSHSHVFLKMQLLKHSNASVCTLSWERILTGERETGERRGDDWRESWDKSKKNEEKHEKREVGSEDPDGESL